MSAFTEAVDNIFDNPELECDGSSDDVNSASTPPRNVTPQARNTPVNYAKRPYMTNGTFTLPSLASKLDSHDGQFLLMYDEVSMLLKMIDKDSKDSPTRQQFLTLADGKGIARTMATSGESHTKCTNMNFCGKNLY